MDPEREFDAVQDCSPVWGLSLRVEERRERGSLDEFGPSEGERC